jgi:predicted N-acyltransferase
MNTWCIGTAAIVRDTNEMRRLSTLSILTGLASLHAEVAEAFLQPNLSHKGRRIGRPVLHSNPSSQRLDGLDAQDSSIENTLKTRKIEFDLHPSILDIPAESWDACLGEKSSPFVEHSWLRCLEESKCASPETGWVPQHVSIQLDGKVRGYVPLFIKGHSMGEFIFDNSWAEAAYQNGISYYPKLLVGVPFTPATGQRLLFHPKIYEEMSTDDIAKLRQVVGSFLKQVAASNKISSVHLNFLTGEECTDLAGPLPQPKAEEDSDSLKSKVRSVLDHLDQFRFEDKNDYLRRTSLQYHWANANANNDGKPYQSFEDYLGCFKSKRRIAIRRERKKVMEDEQIRVDAIAGKDILQYEGLVERMFEIYVSTIDKMYWGRQYLTLEFFQLLAKSDFVKNLCFMCARHRSTGEKLRAEDVFAGTVNIVKDGVFYGRYWGCLRGKEVKNLHFEACYWSAIEYCIQNGLKRMEPGAGGGGECPETCAISALLFSFRFFSHEHLTLSSSRL